MSIPWVHRPSLASRLLLPVLGCLVSLAPPAPAATEAPTPIDVAVTVSPQAFLVERIGGARVRVHVTVAPGQIPETYQPTDIEASRVLKSQVYFRLGLPAEHGPWFRAVERSGRVRVVDLRHGVELLELQGHLHGEVAEHHAEPHHHGEPAEKGPAGHGTHRHEGLDPHVWLSPRRLSTMAETVAETLCETDPASAAEYRRNLGKLLDELATLDADLERMLAPWRGRPFFVFHPAWGYLADDYGLRQVAIEVEGKEPSEAELTKLQRLFREQGARTLFVQPQVTGRAAHTVAAAVGARVEVIDPLARDVAANLRHVARRLVASFEQSDAGPPPRRP